MKTFKVKHQTEDQEMTACEDCVNEYGYEIVSKVVAETNKPPAITCEQCGREFEKVSHW